MMTVPPYNDRHEGMMYAKLYATILRSSIWLENDETRLLWIAMLAAADEKGYVFGSPAGMAHTARISVEAVKAALLKFSSPDPDSSDLSDNPENEGRRIEVVDGGWRLINYATYRAIRDSEERRAQNREAKRRQRERESAKVSQDQPESAKVSPSESELESEKESEEDNTFVRFWVKYPRRVKKQAAIKAWTKLSDQDHDRVMAVLPSWPFDSREDGRFIPHPASWLNERRWEDESVVLPPKPKPKLSPEDELYREAEIRTRKEIAESIRLRKEKGLPV